jgi:REP element-mobilizing transposase RayT
VAPNLRRQANLRGHLQLPSPIWTNHAGICHANTPSVPHFYPKHLDGFSYLGRYSYALTFAADNRASLLNERGAIDLVATQLRRASREAGFLIAGYCLMPDHAHLVIDGQGEDSNGRTFISRAKQYSGYYYKQAYKRNLWQRYGYERVIRDDYERALSIRYLLANPVRAGFVADPRRFAGLGSEIHTIDQLMEVCEYSGAYALD